MIKIPSPFEQKATTIQPKSPQSLPTGDDESKGFGFCKKTRTFVRKKKLYSSTRK